MKHILVLSIFLVSALVKAQSQTGTFPAAPDSILKTLQKEHPRLIATAKDFEQVRSKVQNDKEFNARFQELVKKGDNLLTAPVSKYVIPDGLRLLAVSRAVMDRMYTLAFLYKVTGEKKYADRAWQELDAAAKFPDWNPKHFLDVGEMTHAFAIAYDWMYDYFSTDQKQQIRHAIIEHGLSRALFAYQGLALKNMSWWINVGHNWNQVCNGGIGTGALAIADEEPKLCEAILQAVIKYLPTAMKHYGPDGAWDEGPGYWSYATRYSVAILASMQTALGSDFGLSDIEGFSKTALFPVYVTGPVNKSFNYADGGDSKIGGFSLAWLAQEYNHPWIAEYQRKQGGSHPLDLLWNSSEPTKVKPKEIPLDAYFRNAEVVTMRSRWNDSTALFIGFKAGDNKANHSNLDLGSFVLDAVGERWVVDLGAENYNLPGYFSTGRNGKRWTYYRMRPESHNTLVFNPSQDPGQDPEAAARIIKFNTTASNAFAIANLTPAYSQYVKNVKRGIAMSERRSIIVRDEFEAGKNVDVNWFVHTPAKITIDATGRKAMLLLNNKVMTANILTPANAQFTVFDARPLPTSPQPEGINPNKGISRLAIIINGVKNDNITVEFTPDTKASSNSKFLQPLHSW